MSDDRKIRVIVAGAAGKMGTEAVRALHEDARFTVAAALVRRSGQALAFAEIPTYHDKEALLSAVQADVWLDLTDAGSVVQNAETCIANGIRPVLGATGYQMTDITRLDTALKEQGLGGVAAPNFAIGALLMMRFAREAARFLPKAEIVELHHDGKKDAPSGTAKRTAQGMIEEGANDVPIHSVRLPGLVAHQEVLFGGTGEVLTIRHDSLSRLSFMPGVLLACEKVMQLNGLVYGLEHLMF